MNIQFPPRVTKSPFRLLLLISAVIVFGAVFSLGLGYTEDQRMREELLIQARIALMSINPEQVRQLRGSPDDLDTSDYRRLKDKLMQIRSGNNRYRFLYLMGRRPDGVVYFFLDSEPANSPDNSPPGQTYDEAPETVKQVFKVGESAVQGPYVDRWGTWVSAFMRMNDPATGEILAVFGMDVDSTDWWKRVALYSATPVSIATLLSVLLAMLFTLYQRVEREKQSIAASGTILKKYEQIVSGNPDLMSLIDRNYTFQIINDAYPRIFNKTREEIVGHTLAELYGQEFFLAHQKQPFDRALSGQNDGYETWFDLPVLGRRYLIISYTPHREGERVSGIVVSGRDITERKEAEEALRDSEQRMRLATEATEVGIWEWNVITNKIRWDAQMFRIYGIAPTKDGFVEYSDWSGSVVPEELRQQEEVLQDTVRRLGHSTREFHIRRRDDRECRLIHAVEMVRTNAQGQAEWVVGTNLDITERKNAEETLLTSEQRLRGLLEFSPIAVRIARAGREVVFCNQSYATLVRVERNKVIGIDPRSYYAHPEDYDRILVELSRGATIRNRLVELVVSDKGPTWAMSSYEPIMYQGENAVIGWFYDITALKNAEQALRISEEQQRLLITQSPAALAMFDRDMCYISVSDRWRSDYKLGQQDLAGRSHYEVFPEIPDRWRKIHQRCLAGAVEKCEEDRFERHDGTVQWLRWEVRPWFKTPGKIGGIVMLTEDITARREAAEEKNKQSQLTLQYKEILLNLSQQQFGNLDDHFHAITEAAARALTVERIGIWTLHNNTLESQDLFYASTGVHQRVVPYTLTGASPYFNALQHQEVIRADNARSDPRTCEFDAFLKSKDIHSMLDVPIWHQGSMIGLLGCDHTGMVRHWTDLEEEFTSHLAALASTAMEAEERRRAEKTIMDLNESLEQRVAERTAELSRVNAELELARNAAAAASEAKSEFLSRMSHELRTPLHAILGFSQMLEGSLSNAPQDEKKSVQLIQHSGQHLLELINETLDLARIEEGKLELSLEDIDLNHGICTECLDQIRGPAEKNNIAVNLKAGASPIVVYADHIRLKQVLLNLLSNAVKYNRPQGSVTLEYHAPRKEQVRVTVTDTGVGIARDQQDRIFQPFTRIHRHDSSIEGTGIGLTITRRLVEEMGGKIGFASEVGVGSTFWLELRAGRKTPRVKPLTTAAGERRAATATTPAIKGKVLYIEDTTANVQLMRMIVKRLPRMEFLDSNTAELGIVLATEQHPDLILMDIDLPGMDGIEALQRLRQEEKTRDIPVIAVSAAAMPHDLERIQQAGFDDILSKPFNIQSVPALLLKHLGTRRNAGPDSK